MRSLVRIVGAAGLAGAFAACGVITGLSSYSTGPCTEGCDASVNGIDASQGMMHDATASTDGTEGDDSADGGLEGDGEAGQVGCATGLITCEAGCVDPSLAATCGGCSTECGGDASMCASDLDGSFACTSVCPASSPTACADSCVNTTSNVNNCMTCGNACTTAVANATPACVSSACTFTCNANYTLCGVACVNTMTDVNNCGGCGTAHACAGSQTCVAGVCTTPVADSGSGGNDSGPGGGSDAGLDAAAIPCPTGGCPSSTATGYFCPTFGHCNGTTSECSTGGGCFCSNDTQCVSQKCVKVTGENDVSCGTCTGTGSRDGYNCQLVPPGIPAPTGTTTYACPAGSGFHGTQLSCDPTHTNCYCTADAQCPTGKCIPNANNGSCGSAGPCTGSGTPDYRGCVSPTALASSCAAPYCGSACAIGYCTAGFACSGTCLCTNDNQCESGACVKGSANGGSCGSNCTGSGTADSHSCVVPPSSIACVGTGGTACTTSLTPAPVLNSGKTACLCVADAECSTGKCVNSNGQCAAGACSGTAPADAEDCETYTSVVNAYGCSNGNCDNVSSSTGTCTSANVPCWCTGDSQCPGATACSSWKGCASGACSGSGTGNAFNCVP